MVELVQTAWGDWWVVVDAIEVVAVHLRGSCDKRTREIALEHARELFPDETIAVHRFPGATVPGDRLLRTEGSAVQDLKADEAHPLGSDHRRPTL